MKIILVLKVLIILVLIYAVACYLALGQMDALDPKVPIFSTIVLGILGFPFMVFWSYLGGDQLKLLVGDGITMLIFSSIDLILWSIMIALFINWIIRLKNKDA